MDQSTYALRIAATNSSGSGIGRMNFHSATFAVTNSIVVGYDARTQGWTETTGAGTSVGGDPLQVHDV